MRKDERQTTQTLYWLMLSILRVNKSGTKQFEISPGSNISELEPNLTGNMGCSIRLAMMLDIWLRMWQLSPRQIYIWTLTDSHQRDMCLFVIIRSNTHQKQAHISSQPYIKTQHYGRLERLCYLLQLFQQTGESLIRYILGLMKKGLIFVRELTSITWLSITTDTWQDEWGRLHIIRLIVEHSVV